MQVLNLKHQILFRGVHDQTKNELIT